MMKMRNKVAAAVAGLALSLGASADPIDLFSTNQGLYTDNTPDSTDTGLIILSGIGGSVGAGDLTILGGNRDLFVSLLDNDGNTNRDTSIGVNGGVLDFNVDSLAKGRGQIQWDGGTNTDNTIDYTGLSGVDLTAGGTLNTVALDIVFNDQPFNFEITLYTSSTNWTKIAFVANVHATPETTYIPLAAFSNDALCGIPNPAPGVTLITCGGTGGEINNAGAVVVDLDRFGGTTSIDLTIDNIRTIPEPGVLGLAGLGLLMGFGFGRRKNV